MQTKLQKVFLLFNQKKFHLKLAELCFIELMNYYPKMKILLLKLLNQQEVTKTKFLKQKREITI